MKIKGVNYDVGTYYSKYPSRVLSLKRMNRDIEMIRKGLHANSVRVYGMEKNQLFIASKNFLDKGFEVWYSPRHVNFSQEETLKKIEEYAKDAEILRKNSSKVVFVLGNEFTLEVNGFYSALTWKERAGELGHADHKLANKLLIPFLRKALSVARKNFKGKITYAAGFWELVDWKNFDFVSVNKYMFAWNRKSYETELKLLKSYHKPIVITEFGTGSFKGVLNKNEPCFSIVDWKTRRIVGKYIRDEGEQARHMESLLKMFEKNKIHGAFPYTFVEESYLYSKKPQEDLDMASLNLVKVLKNGHYFPKKSFRAISKFYKAH